MLSPFKGLRSITTILDGLEEDAGIGEARVLQQAICDFQAGIAAGEFTLPDADWIGLENLLRLANKHRALGHWQQAEGLYQRMRRLGLPEETELAVKLEQFLLSVQRGRPRPELGHEVRVGARSLGSSRLEAKAILQLARLGGVPVDELVKARDTFLGWEDHLEAACCALLLQQSSDERAMITRHDADLLEQARAALPELESVVDDHQRDCQIKLFGPFRVLFQGRLFPDEDWNSRKDRLLFAYLGAQAGKVVTEETLLELLWNHGGEKARHSLHNSVSQARRVLSRFSGLKGRDLIERVSDGYRLGGCFEVDLALFGEFFENGTKQSLAGSWESALLHLQRAERLVRGDFMEGDYQEWTFPLREDVELRLVDLLSTLAGYFSHRGKFEKAVEYWRRVLELDRCSEEAYESLLELYRELGRQADAHRLYLAAEASFEEELGVAVPDSVVQAYRLLSEV